MFPFRRAESFLIAVVLLLGALQNFAHRYAVVSDTVPYLEIARQLQRGHWGAGLNSLWSPLYPAFLALVTGVLRPNFWWGFPAVHLADFLILLAATAAFAFLVRSLQFSAYARIAAWLAFAWSSLTSLGAVSTPDMLVATGVYLSSGLMARKHYVALGAVLGLSYWAKAPMFPLGLAFLAIAGMAFREWKRVAQGCAVFLVISAPLVVGLSWKYGRPTFGESGRLNYLWHVESYSCEPEQGAPPVATLPAVEGVTNAFYYDPGPCCADARIQFSLRRQISYSAKLAASFLFHSDLSRVAGLFVFLALVPWSYRGSWPWLAPFLFAFVMYAGVNIEWRYLAPFLIVAIAGTLEKVDLSLPATKAIALVFALAIGLQLAQDAFVSPQPVQQEVARELVRLGVRPNDHVATVVGGADNFWEFLTHTHLVAEIRPDHSAEFWGPNQQDSLRRFSAAGARAVVASQVPHSADTAGWIALGHGYLLYWIR